MYDGERLKATLSNEGVLTITLHNPDLLNALDQQMAAEARELRKLYDNHQIRVIVVTGHGRVFSAGGDLNYLDSLTRMSEERVISEMRPFYRSFLDLVLYDVPSIAFINGHAVGAGLCFALACDFIMVNEEAKIGVNFVKLGLAPGMAAEWVMRRLPPVLANEMLLTGRIYRARELQQWPVFNYLGPAERLTDQVQELAAELAGNSSRAIRFTLDNLRDRTRPLEQVLDRQAQAQADCAVNGEVQGAIVAVREKRPYDFQD